LKFTAEIKLVKGGFADSTAVTAYTDKLKAESKIFAGASIHKSKDNTYTVANSKPTTVTAEP